MDAVLLTWRWQNILSILVIMVGWALLLTIGAQVVRKISNQSNA